MPSARALWGQTARMTRCFWWTPRAHLDFVCGSNSRTSRLRVHIVKKMSNAVPMVVVNMSGKCNVVLLFRSAPRSCKFMTGVSDAAEPLIVLIRFFFQLFDVGQHDRLPVVPRTRRRYLPGYPRPSCRSVCRPGMRLGVLCSGQHVLLRRQGLHVLLSSI